MSEKIYVLIDHGEGEIRTPSLESLALGQRMAEEAGFSLHALILGNEIGPLAERLGKQKVDSVLLVEDQKLANYDPDVYCRALSEILTEDQPYLLLMGHIYQNIDLAPKLAAAINRGLVTDCIGYRKEGDEFVFVRQMFRNKLNADVQVRSEHPWIVTLQTGATSVDDLMEGSAPQPGRSPPLNHPHWSLQFAGSRSMDARIGTARPR